MEGIRGEDGGLQGLDGGRELVVDESCWRLVRRGGGGPTSGGGGVRLVAVALPAASQWRLRPRQFDNATATTFLRGKS